MKQVKTWFQNRRMKHKKHLRKQNSGRSTVDGNGSEDKDLSDYEDVTGEGDDEPDEDMEATSNENFENNVASCQENDARVTKNEVQQETPIEGKLFM